MVSAMIDECIFENLESYLKLKKQNGLHNHIHLLESKRRKRICKSYNEIERGEKNESL